ncbi:GHKL domain-containing protein [Streptococcus loxodontisalivarius]
MSSRFLLFWVIPSLLEMKQPSDFLLLLSYICVYPIYLLISEFLALDFESIRQMDKSHKSTHWVLKGLLGSMTVYYVLVYSFFSPHFGLFAMEHQVELKISVMLYFLVFLSLLSYLNRTCKNYLELQSLKQNSKMLSDMESYNLHIEQLYLQLEEFKQDAERELLDLKGRIEKGHLSEIKEGYQSLLDPKKASLSTSSAEMSCLINMQVSPVKSLVFAKLLEANQLGVKTYIEVPEEIDHFHMEILDIVLCLSIFLDNAIEAAVEAPCPELCLAFLRDGMDQIVIVENAMKEKEHYLSELFKRDKSTKGQGRGLGLAKLSDTISKYPNVSLTTKSDHYLFTQTLYIRRG